MEREIDGGATDLAPPPVNDELPVQRVQDDYFAFDRTERITLPDGISWVDIQVLNEGARRKYLNAVNRDVRIQKGTQDAILKMSPGEERTELLRAAIKGWNLKRGGVPIPFNPQNLNEFLSLANPSLINLIEKEVRLANPWLLAEMTVEDIDREISDLQELRAKKLEEDEGKGLSKSR